MQPTFAQDSESLHPVNEHSVMLPPLEGSHWDLQKSNSVGEHMQLQKKHFLQGYDHL